MTDLRELFEDLAERGRPRGADAVFDGATADAVVVRRSRARRHRVALASAAAAVAVIIAAIAITTRGSKPGEHINAGLPPTTARKVTTAQLAAGTWSTLPAAPVPALHPANTVWTGSEMIVWGYNSEDSGSVGRGAAYNPDTQTWRALPQSPLAAGVHNVVVWTGAELVVWGGDDFERTITPDGAAYNPATNQWRALPAAPTMTVHGAIGVWTGTNVMVLAQNGAASYDPKTNHWTLVPLPAAPPHPLQWTIAAQVGDHQLVAWSMPDVETPTANGYQPTGGTDTYVFDERAGRWAIAPTSHAYISIPQEAFSVGTRVLVRGDMHLTGAQGPGPLPEVSAWFDPATLTFTRLPADALTANNVAAGHFTSVWTGNALISLNLQGQYGGPQGSVEPGDGSVYDASTNTWQRIATRAPSRCDTTNLVWTGAQVLAYCPSGSSAGLALTPASTTTEARGTVTGSLRMIGGPAPGVNRGVAGTVVATASNGRRFMGSAASDGSFLLALPPGSYTITGRSPSYVGGTSDCVAGEPVRVTANATVTVSAICPVR